MKLLESLRSALVLLLIAVWPCFAQTDRDVTVDEVKAAFLYRFLDFVEWPAAKKDSGSIVIGVMEAPQVETELQRIVQARAQRGRSIAVKRVTSIEEATAVNVLFIGMRDRQRISRIAAALRRLPILTVTDAPDGLDAGGMINFVTSDRVRFEVALDAAERAGLHLNANLLAVALRVRKSEIAAPYSVLAGLNRARLRLSHSIRGCRLFRESRVLFRRA